MHVLSRAACVTVVGERAGDGACDAGGVGVLPARLLNDSYAVGVDRLSVGGDEPSPRGGRHCAALVVAALVHAVQGRWLVLSQNATGENHRRNPVGP